MRVYLMNGKTVTKENGAKISWASDSFCEVPEELGQSWINSGDACSATKDNVAIMSELKEEQPETLMSMPDQPLDTSSDPELLEEEITGS